MIQIIDDKTYNKYYYMEDECWDFSLEEINYLLQEHCGETFLLKNGRLYEVLDKESD
jgi:hypothetical protein